MGLYPPYLVATLLQPMLLLLLSFFPWIVVVILDCMIFSLEPILLRVEGLVEIVEGTASFQPRGFPPL